MAICQLCIPNKIRLGLGVLDNLAGDIQETKAKKILLVTGTNVAKSSIFETIKNKLAHVSATIEVFSQTEPEPSLASLNSAAMKLRSGKHDLIIGLGGGSNMDMAKGLSLLLAHGGKAEFYVGAGKVPGPCIPVVAIPTTSGTGSEATSICVFSDNEKLIKAAIVSPFLMPRLALVDPFLTYNCPNSVTASAGIDALVHVIECYTSNKANSFSDALALKAMELINKSLRTVVKNGSNREARNYMAEAALLAGIAFGNSGVAAVHALSYALGSRFHIAHGVANGLLLSYVMKYNLPSNFTKYATIAQILDPRLDSIQFSSPQKKAEHGVEVVKKLTIDIGIPVHLKELGVPYDKLREIAVVAMDGSRLLENNPKRLGLEDILGILESAW